MKKLFTILILSGLGLGFTLSKAPHEFYVSNTELEIVNDTLQISTNINMDDLSLVLKERNQLVFDLLKNDDFDKNNTAIQNYLEERLSVKSKNKKLSINWLGHEPDGDAVWAFGFAVLPAGATSISVENGVLLDRFPEQHNIINLKRSDRFDTKLCSRYKRTVSFSI